MAYKNNRIDWVMIMLVSGIVIASIFIVALIFLY
jgi:hypothetical protein